MQRFIKKERKKRKYITLDRVLLDNTNRISAGWER